MSGPAIRLFVGGHAGTLPRPGPDGTRERERENLVGDRCFSAAHAPAKAGYGQVDQVIGFLDSGAFTDAPSARLTPAQALARQLAWETKASGIWGAPWQAAYIASYDLLIDETWVAGERHKRRWSLHAAERAVQETVDAAAFLADQRAALAPRTLVLGVQGVDPWQYAECLEGVLAHAAPPDWVGLGGWCILGKIRSYLPSFWATLHLALPRIAAAGVGHVHLYGVLWRPAVGGLLHLADRHDLTVSVDSSGPILNCVWKNPRKAGTLAPYWRDNVAAWQRTLAGLRTSPYYRPPPAVTPARQATLWEVA